MYMKIISFDIGIKNMAYCLFDICNNQTQIIDWKVMSLMDEDIPNPKCNCIKSTMNKSNDLCGKKSKYTINTTDGNELFLCEKHAKTSNYIIPHQRFNLKKLNIEGLINLCRELKLDDLPKKKGDIIIKLNKYLDVHCLKNISNKSSKACEVDLITLGHSIKSKFIILTNQHPDLKVVIIENQISPLANRMKTVQGMLAQFFIMIYEDIKVEFISSSNKLKIFPSDEKKVSSQDKTQSQIYNEHKKDGVFFCERVLRLFPHLDNELWMNCEKKKKDDLADCFLQGIWWMKHNNKISFPSNETIPIND
jgi:hypothetical protein